MEQPLAVSEEISRVKMASDGTNVNLIVLAKTADQRGFYPLWHNANRRSEGTSQTHIEQYVNLPWKHSRET